MMNPKRLVNLIVRYVFLAGLSTTPVFLAIPFASADSFNMIGTWSGSPDCPITFYKDDGRYVEGNCDNGAFNHIFRGSYSNPNQISLTLTRIDPNHCQTSVPTYIQVINNNHVKYWQGGWDGCGIRTKPITQDWYRVGDFSGNSTIPTIETSPTISTPTAEPSPTTYPSTTPPTNTPDQRPCLIKIGEFCILQ